MARRGKRRRTAPPSAPGPGIVAIGASAGGFDAICALLRGLPARSGLGFVILQHLIPSQRSFSAEIFSKRTAMGVTIARSGERLEANRVYTVPSGVLATMTNGIIRFGKPDSLQEQRRPIDHFFHSLANDRKERAIGIILSGTGSDGTFGVKRIADRGGVVMVQAPATARFDGMPRSAIATGVVDCVLPVEKMPAAIVRYSRRRPGRRSPAGASAAETESESLGRILDVIRRDRGFSFDGYKQRMLLRRVRRRMQLSGAASMHDYGERMRGDPQEVDALARDMLIGVTEFFRDPEAWRLLDAKVIRPLIASKDADEPVRTWVAATGTGEEAYSLAMLLLERIRIEGKRCTVQVFATDRSLESLETARAGVYSAHAVARIPARLRSRYFTAIVDRPEFRVTRTLRDAVVFGPQNLFADPPFSRVDLVNCRNLLIYLEPEVQQRILRTIHFALRPGGHLFLGSAETCGEPGKLFAPVSRKWRIYRRLDVATPDPLQWSALPKGTRVARTEIRATPPTRRSATARELAERVILEQFAPASVLVNDRGETLYFAGPTDRYVRQPQGTPVSDVLSLAREGLRSQLRSALRKATRRNAATIVSEASVKRDGVFRSVTLTVTPIVASQGAERLQLVVFRDGPLRSERRAGGSVGGAALVRRLELELRATRSDLQSTIERLAGSNEELREANEETISVNEELQSLNEELESSKEELQSLNEELNTVNQQLQVKVVELETANNDLENLLASSDVATLCVDRQLRIKWFTPAARDTLRLIDADVGRPVVDLGSPLAGAALVESARKVLQTKTTLQTELHTPDGRWYLRRVLPYRTESKRIEGVVVNFNDFTETRHAVESAVESARKSRDLELQVDARTHDVAALAAKLALAEERERAAIARDLHDNLGQLLNVAQLRVASLASAANGGGADARLADLRAVIDQAAAGVHSLAAQLHPPVLSELGLVPAIEWLADEMRRQYGFTVELHDDGFAKPLSQEKRSIVYRAVRELLVNIGKHAKVESASVDVSARDGRLVVTVADEGVGYDPALVAPAGRGSQGLGLMNVRERLRFVHGTFTVRSVPGIGTTATMNVPLDEATSLVERVDI